MRRPNPRLRPGTATADPLKLRMVILGDCVGVDAPAFAERLVARLTSDGVHGDLDMDRVRAITLPPTMQTLREASAALEQTWCRHRAREVSYFAEAFARSDYYAAIMGCQPSAFRVSGQALICAHDRYLPNRARNSLLEAALCWLMWAAAGLPSASGTSDSVTRAAPESCATEWGRELAM